MQAGIGRFWGKGFAISILKLVCRPDLPLIWQALHASLPVDKARVFT